MDNMKDLFIMKYLEKQKYVPLMEYQYVELKEMEY